MKKKLFLSFEDAVYVAVMRLNADPDIAYQELEQKCYISDDQYGVGYNDGLADAIDAIKRIGKDEED